MIEKRIFLIFSSFLSIGFPAKVTGSINIFKFGAMAGIQWLHTRGNLEGGKHKSPLWRAFHDNNSPNVKREIYMWKSCIVYNNICVWWNSYDIPGPAPFDQPAKRTLTWSVVKLVSLLGSSLRGATLSFVAFSFNNKPGYTSLIAHCGIITFHSDCLGCFSLNDDMVIYMNKPTAW